MIGIGHAHLARGGSRDTRGWATGRAEALRHAADRLEAVPLDGAAEALAWLETQLESFLREAERAFRIDPDAT